jgi:CRISPR-associated protein Csb2
MSELVIQCRYIAHSYTGVRQNRDRRDELDWPPAPARLHQAFLASTLANLPDSRRDEFAGKTLDALRWLEKLPPPDVIASRLADDSGYRRTLKVAMPHNSPWKPGEFSREHSDLAPVLRATPAYDGQLFAAYRWTGDAQEFSRNAELHLPTLCEAAAKLRYMGRAEDRVECEVHWRETENEGPTGDALEIWRPSAQTEDVYLLTARPDSTQELMDEFKKAAHRRAREAKNPARLFLREQSYTRDAAEGLLPVHVAIFQIYEDGNPDAEVCDAINAHRWRSPLRARACEIAKETDRWNNAALADELISGHGTAGEYTQQPHLAFVPLPSLSASGKADGRVRRCALLGYASKDVKDEAISIYRTLAANLDGKETEEGSGYRFQLVDDLHRDKVWPLYNRASKVWATATPLAIARGFKVPKFDPGGRELSNNERYLRRLSEWTKLVRLSLRDIRLPADLVDSCQIQLTPTPLITATERAERYRPREERIPFLHARIEFLRPVRGPLLVGDRRYFGLGLFMPMIESGMGQRPDARSEVSFPNQVNL